MSSPLNMSRADPEKDFLQDQVRRLTAVVREYQRHYLPLEERNIKSAQLEPWMSHASMLSPLLVEYDSNIKLLKEQVQQYKAEFEKLREKSNSIVQENDRLHRELRGLVENQLNTIQQSDDVSGEAKLQLAQLQRKVKDLTEDKEHMQVLYDEASNNLQSVKEELRDKSQKYGSLTSEIDMLQDDLNRARIFAEGMQKGNYRLKLEHEQFLKTAQIQDKEMDELRMENRKINGELKTLKSLTNEIQTHNNKLQEQLKFFDKNAKHEMITEKSAEGTIRKLRNEIIELDSRVVSYAKELGNLRNDKTELEEQLSSLQRKNATLEESEYHAIVRVKDSVQLVENALLEREQAIVREQQKSQEVNRLQDAINNLLKQAEEQRKKEVAAVKQQGNKQINALVEELHSHELELAEKQASFEKLQRDKTSLEKELEKVYEEGPAEVAKAGLSLEELQKRLSKLELSRDEALLQIDALQANLRRNKNKWENDHSSYLNQINGYKSQVATLKKDLDEMAESRLKLLDEVSSLKKALQSKSQDNAALDISCSSQVSSLQQQLEIKEREYESRLRATENMNKEAMNELREMLSLQQKNGAKWRDESRSLCQKFERTITQLRQENSSLKHKNGEMQQSLTDQQLRTEELEKEYYDNQIAIDKLQRVYADSDARIETANTQVQTLLGREKQLLSDRKSLNREVDKLRLNISRLNKSQTMEQQWDSYLDRRK